MSLKSIKIKNLLSFKDFEIKDLTDINCFIGKNNVGKSNVLKIISFYYDALKGENKKNLQLNSKYSNHGEITITFDTSRLEDIIRTNKNRSPYQKHIYKSIYKSEVESLYYLNKSNKNKKFLTLTLILHKNNSISWSNNDKNVREIISRIYPFFAIDTRRLDLYNWKYLWNVVTKLKFLNTKQLSRDEIVSFIDLNISQKSNSYKDYVNTIKNITKTSPYEYQDHLLNYIKVGLEGHTFNIDGNELDTQSDGTNSHKFLEIFLNLVIALTRREFITPIILIDEPEIGLHPKRNEELIDNLGNIYHKLKNDTGEWEKGKYKTPYPTMIFTTHSPNILKTIIKQFNRPNEHKIYHFTTEDNNTCCSIMKSYFNDERFINVFNDNEARLFFSNFILFVEGETELELFGNLNLRKLFPKLNKIDVYKTNEVMLNAIKPSNSNVSIPYLVLYDADKMVSVNFRNGSINFLSKEVNIFTIKEKYKLSFYGSKRYHYYKEFKSILKLDNRQNELTKNKISFELMEKTIEKVNNIITKTERIKIANNTTEGFFINENSYKLFIRWLINEFITHAKVGSKGDPNKIISIHQNKPAKDFNIIKCFKAIFNNYPLKHKLTDVNMKFAEKVKKDFLKEMGKKVLAEKLTKKEKIIILRMAFEGKSDTLCSKENENYQHIPQNIKSLIKEISDNIIGKLPYGSSKTGGWVTSFLDFSIKNMKEFSTNPPPTMQFKYTFPELYSIISEISSSID
ncbi:MULTISPECIES: retron Eco8 family effector endonuclease [Gammaproteobacteria]|uniref:retron Eco8 family effector endonuclease n=1 Tax=Gammaproteobacteria TaxID=1236 RepID=UPI0018677B5D|nr:MULTISPECIES: retron Eco8 family effector endonuclease [Gammaproteobacteria]